ncbi:MAG: metallophosphatase family protein [Rubrivivax sp.]|nr:metallophosphatase family protein [Rubrivivax sp.]
MDRAIELDVDVAVLSGDATDHALDLHAPAALRLLAQVHRLADHCPVLMLQGTWSHEPPGTLSVFSMLGSRHRVFVADRIGQVALMAKPSPPDRPGAAAPAADLWLPSEGPRFTEVPPGARALFTCIPSINKAAVAASVGATAAGQAQGEQLALLLQGYAGIHSQARAAGVPTLAVSHGTVFGCVTEHGVPMAGFDHEFTTGALFSVGAQAFLLGHIHRRQAWTQGESDRRQCIAYAGSIGRFHHGEQGDKGFLLWDVGPAGVDCQFEPTPARRTLDIVFEGRPDLDQLREAVCAQELAGVSVRVRWTVADEDRHEVDRGAIERALAGAADVQLEGRIVPVVRTRAPGISQLVSLADKVRAWASATEVNAAPLLECLERATTAEPEDIVAAVLATPDGSAAHPSADALGDLDPVVTGPRLDLFEAA